MVSTEASRWRRSEDWVGTEVEDSFVMVNIESGKYVSLNATASALWRALETERATDELCDLLIAEFDVGPEDCRRAVDETLETMRALDLAAPL
jgi:hypothetical protein